jgi:hypothetical protein
VSGTGDFGPRLWASFSRGVARPSNGGRGFFSSAPDSLVGFFPCPETPVSQAGDSDPSPLSPETLVSGHRRLRP